MLRWFGYVKECRTTKHTKQKGETKSHIRRPRPILSMKRRFKSFSKRPLCTYKKVEEANDVKLYKDKVISSFISNATVMLGKLERGGAGATLHYISQHVVRNS